MQFGFETIDRTSLREMILDDQVISPACHVLAKYERAQTPAGELFRQADAGEIANRGEDVDADVDQLVRCADGGLPAFTLASTTTGPSPTSDSIQKAYLAIEDARYGDNFIVAAHPHEGIAEPFQFRENESQEPVLMHPANTSLWTPLPDDDDPGDDPADGVHDHRTSVLTIVPSIDIDTDSDNTGAVDRSDWEEEIENHAGYSGKWVTWNSDDDNENGIADYLENAEYEYSPGMSWVPFTDDDLVPVILDRGFEDLSGMDGSVFELKVTLGWGLIYWRDAEKTAIPADSRRLEIACSYWYPLPS